MTITVCDDLPDRPSGRRAHDAADRAPSRYHLAQAPYGRFRVQRAEDGSWMLFWPHRRPERWHSLSRLIAANKWLDTCYPTGSGSQTKARMRRDGYNLVCRLAPGWYEVDEDANGTVDLYWMENAYSCADTKLEKSNMPVYRDDLTGNVNQFDYDFTRRRGRLWMAPGECCDMSGCLELFESLDPRVRLIETFTGTKPDTIYRRRGNEWMASDPPTYLAVAYKTWMRWQAI